MRPHSKDCEVDFSPKKLVLASLRSSLDQEKQSNLVSRELQLREDEVNRLGARFKQTGSVKAVAREFGASS